MDEKLKGQVKDQIKKIILQKTLEDRIADYKSKLTVLAKNAFNGLCPICRKPDSPEYCLCTVLVKVEPLSKPPVSEKQRRAMQAAASGHSTLGIPKSVGKEFSNADEGGKLPEKADKSELSKAENGVAGGNVPGIDAQTNMQMAETPKRKLPMRKAGNVHGSLMSSELNKAPVDDTYVRNTIHRGNNLADMIPRSKAYGNTGTQSKIDLGSINPSESKPAERGGRPSEGGTKPAAKPSGLKRLGEALGSLFDTGRPENFKFSGSTGDPKDKTRVGRPGAVPKQADPSQDKTKVDQKFPHFGEDPVGTSTEPANAHSSSDKNRRNVLDSIDKLKGKNFSVDLTPEGQKGKGSFDEQLQALAGGSKPKSTEDTQVFNSGKTSVGGKPLPFDEPTKVYNKYKDPSEQKTQIRRRPKEKALATSEQSFGNTPAEGSESQFGPKPKLIGKEEMSVSGDKGSASISVSESSGGDQEVRIRGKVKKDEDFDTFDGNMKQGKPTGKLPDGKGTAKERNPKIPPSGTVLPKKDTRYDKEEGVVKPEKNPKGIPTTHAGGKVSNVKPKHSNNKMLKGENGASDDRERKANIKKADPMQNVNHTAKNGIYKVNKKLNPGVAKLESAALSPKDLGSKFTQRPGNIGTAKSSDMLNVDSMEKGAVTPAPSKPTSPPVPPTPKMAKGDMEKCSNVPAMFNKKKLDKAAQLGTPKGDMLADAYRAAKTPSTEGKVKLPSQSEHEQRQSNFNIKPEPQTSSGLELDTPKKPSAGGFEMLRPNKKPQKV